MNRKIQYKDLPVGKEKGACSDNQEQNNWKQYHKVNGHILSKPLIHEDKYSYK